MKYIKFLFSGTFMAALLVVFGVAIGYATFIENDYDASTAKLMVYNARWFEVLLFLMVVNLTGMVFTLQLYRKEKLNILIIHVALVVIIIGAGVTRYMGFEGQMHIRNGQTTNQFLSSETYVSLMLKQGNEILEYDDQVMFSAKKGTGFKKEYEIGGEKIDVSLLNYYPNAVKTLVRDANGMPFLNIVVGDSHGRHEAQIQEGESTMVHDFGISFGDTTKQQNVRIYRKEGRLFLKYPGELKMVSMSNELEGTFNPHEEVPVTMLKLYVVGDISFVVKELIEGAIYKYRPAANNQQQGIPVTELRVNSTNITLPMGQQEVLNTGNTEIAVRVGNKPLELPFSLKLVKFQLERYPGSESPSSYASEVMVIDEANGQEFPYRIYMNNILDYGGFRFYQSSYDRDEQGTILSVNHDYWGTLITYFGYFLLFATLLVSFFTSKNRFRNVLRQIKNLRAERQQAIVGVVIVIVMSFFNYSEVLAQTNIADIDREHAERFGRMLIQDKDGRIVPINTIANKVLVKIYKKNTYYNLSADQVYLDLLSDHNKWQAKPVIYINDPALQSLLGLYDNYARFTDFFNEQGQYKIKDQVDQAYIKKPALRSKFDKELLNVNERVNVFYLTINGSLLNILPLPNDPGNKWATPGHYMHAAAKIPGLDSMIYSKYIYSLNEAKASGNYLEAETNLAKLISYQNEYGAAIIPPEKQTRMEILYNKLNIFKRLFPWYLSLGILLIGTFFMSIFKPGINLKIVEYAIFAVLFIGFIAHTYGLGLRWYVGGHAPWSNGYESMIYIAWAAMLSGFVFLRKAPVTMAVTSTLAGITLLTAHMSWLNPEITNLVPVLKSNWLTIHVATITASYGFFGLAAMMGFLNMCIMILRKRENYIRINFTVRELTLIIELALHAGLVLLVIGNFLGGIWANESWGRYWGWDPKETWTLVTVIFYSFVLHMRLIPKFKTLFTSNFFAVVGFGTVLMTYFGVNYYLSGLHSYAGGDPVPVPDFVYYVLVILGIVSVAALVNEAKLKDDNKPEVQNGNKEELMSRKTEPVF